jgi:rhamnulokinase
MENQYKNMENQNFIAIDFGAESGRLIVGSLNNRKLQMEEIYRFKTQGTTIANSLRWNVVRFWEEIVEGLRKYKIKYGTKAAGIGIDSWGVSFVGLNKYDDLAYLPFHYRAELIADPMLEEFKSSIGEALIFNNTGIQFMALNTSVHIYAMNKKYPDYRSIVKTWLMIPDYFYYLLTNVKINEYTNASTTQLLNARKRTWDDELTQILNIKKTQFPPLMHPGQLIGTITSQVQTQTGLDAIPVYTVATHDTGSAIVAIPHPEPNAPGELWAYLSSGTWSLLGVEIPEPIINAKIQAYNFTNEGGVDNTIRLLKNIMGLWLLQECKREWERTGDNCDYENLTKEALSAPPNQALILPDDTRFFSPASMIQEIQAFCKETNQHVPNTRAEIVRCIFESLACRYREAIEIIQELTEKKITTLHIVGGGSKNKVLTQMTADACQIPVITGPVEATAIGNLLMQARAAGQVKDLSEIRQIVKNSFEVEKFTPQSNWNELYAKYKSLQN